MTETTEIVAVTRTGTGATASFSFPFKIASNDELEVIFIDIDDSETLLVEGVTDADYAVTVTTYPGSGTITYPADSSSFISSSQHLHIRRKTPVTQNVLLNTQGGYNPQTQERAFDKITRISQEQADALARAPQVPETTEFEGLAGASPIVNDTEDGFRWAVGFEGPAGADGTSGPSGPPGPWRYVQSVTGTAAATIDCEGFFNDGHTYVALMFVPEDLRPNTDNVDLLIRLKLNGAYQSDGTYKNVVSGLDSGGGALASSSNTSTALVPNHGVGNIGNAAGEIWAGVINFSNPGSAEDKYAWAVSCYALPDGDVATAVFSGAYTGATRADPLEGVRFLAGSGNITGTVHVYGLLAESAALITPVTAFKSGVPTSSEVILRYVFTDSGDFAVDYALSQLSAGTAATAETIFNIEINGSGAGTITVAAAGTTGTFDNSAAGLAVVAGDVLTVIAPATADTTLADISINMRAILDL